MHRKWNPCVVWFTVARDCVVLCGIARDCVLRAGSLVASPVRKLDVVRQPALSWARIMRVLWVDRVVLIALVGLVKGLLLQFGRCYLFSVTYYLPPCFCLPACDSRLLVCQQLQSPSFLFVLSRTLCAISKWELIATQWSKAHGCLNSRAADPISCSCCLVHLNQIPAHMEVAPQPTQKL